MLRVLVCSLIGAALLTAPAGAAIQLTDGVNASGWQVSLYDAAIGVSNITVDLSAGTVTFDVQKNYGPMVGEGDDAEFPVGLMVFHEVLPAANTVPKIIIRQEQIINSSGGIIDEFRWIFSPTGCGHFDTTSTWNVAPFAQEQWLSPNLLVASQGAFGDGQIFNPNGDLTLLANRNGDIQLKEYVAPEPGSMALVTLAGLCLIRRRRR